METKIAPKVSHVGFHVDTWAKKGQQTKRFKLHLPANVVFEVEA